MRPVLLSLCLALASAAHAANDEFWPEVRLYQQLNETARLYFSADYTEGKESSAASTSASANVTAAVDVSLEPRWRARAVGRSRDPGAERARRAAGRDLVRGPGARGPALEAKWYY
jgi:hypothetical protein